MNHPGYCLPRLRFFFRFFLRAAVPSWLEPGRGGLESEGLGWAGLGWAGLGRGGFGGAGLAGSEARGFGLAGLGFDALACLPAPAGTAFGRSLRSASPQRLDAMK